MNKPIMAKATAVWLVDNTTITFKQVADFCGLHELEVQGIADGDVAAGVKGFDPIANNQLTQEESARQIDLQHSPPPGLGYLQDRREIANPRELCEALVERFADRFPVVQQRPFEELVEGVVLRIA